MDRSTCDNHHGSQKFAIIDHGELPDVANNYVVNPILDYRVLLQDLLFFCLNFLYYLTSIDKTDKDSS